MSIPTLTYCTNIHPARGLEAVRDSLERISVPLKARRSPDAPLPIGLRLSNEESRELLAGDALERFRDWLDRSGLDVACLNGFPFGPFHGGRIKDAVHEPDWRDDRRLEYTLRLARIGAALRPAGASAGVSTSPLSYKPWGRISTGERMRMTRHVALAAAGFARLSIETGVDLHLDIEPEPDGLIETAAEFTHWFRNELAPIAVPLFCDELNLAADDAEREIARRVAVCLDTCHGAVLFESPESALDLYERHGVRIGRVQASAALRIEIPQDQAARTALRARLLPFANSPYLHQTVGSAQDGRADRWRDLPEAIKKIETTTAREWRIHFHLPLFFPGNPPLDTTRDGAAELIRLVYTRGLCDVYEAETYTWDVAPPELRLELVESLELELQWLHRIIRESSEGMRE